MEDTRHRTAFLDGGAILNIPLFCLQGFYFRFLLSCLCEYFIPKWIHSSCCSGVVLFPGATLPLRVTVSRFVTAIERALSQVDVPYTIGVVCYLIPY